MHLLIAICFGTYFEHEATLLWSSMIFCSKQFVGVDWAWYFAVPTAKRNVLESLLGTLSMNDKSKDTLKARLDLKDMKGVETRFNRHERNEDELNRTHEFQVFRSICKLVGKEVYTPLSAQVKQRVVWFVLNNTSEIETGIEACKKAFPNNVVEEEFTLWFDDQIRQKSVKKDPTCTPELFSLACGPNAITRSFTACLVNGVRFLVHKRDIHRTTQNSRVSTPGEHGEMYHGRLKEILELTYIRNHKDEQDVIHGGTSSDVALSNEFPDLDDTVLSTNDESTEVDVSLDTEVCNDDDDDFIYDIDDVAHDIGFDDEVDPTDDEFAKVGPARIDVVSSDEDD
ncbi:hypothetical protein Tco_0580296 [Tanacetum coccineum]